MKEGFKKKSAPPDRPLDLALLRRLWSFTDPHHKIRNRLTALVVIRSIQLPLISWAIGAVIRGPITAKDSLGIIWGVLGFLSLAFTTFLILASRQRLSQELGERTMRDLRSKIFEHLLRQPISFFRKNRLGSLISRVTSDVESVRAGIQGVFFVCIVQGGQMLIAGLLMFYFDAVLFGVAMLILPVFWAVNRYFRKEYSRSLREVQESFSRVTSALAEAVNGIRLTQSYAREEQNASQFEELIHDHSEYNLRIGRLGAIFGPLLEFNSQLFIAILVLLGGYRILQPDAPMEIGAMIQFFFLAGIFFSPVQAIGNQYNQALTAMAGAERIFQLLDTKPEWEDAPGLVALPSLQGVVEFRNVSFEYEPGKPILKKVSFTVEPGQVIALVGPTGSGKTTITSLVSKFYLLNHGEIFLDGREIRTIPFHDLHRQMAMVTQQNFLFTGTVRENLRWGRPEATDDEIVNAARSLDCLDLVEGLARGFDTEVGERGTQLSVGERQILCFLRAMIANPKILVLDEATSAVDAITEARIQAALARLVLHRTSFVIAHRLSTIREAHQVLVLQRGEIVERGTHSSLLQENGLYAGMYRKFTSSPG